jgi:hypothetical protein
VAKTIPAFPAFAIGDRVAISVNFLRNIADFSHKSASQRGHVTHVSPVHGHVTLVQVQWDDGHVSKSLNTNLTLASRVQFERD